MPRALFLECAMRLTRRVSSAALFLLPFAVLVALWAVLVPYFDVNPRLFPRLSAVIAAGMEGIQDGTLVTHIGASLWRVCVGTVLALIAAIPLGVAMGVSPVVSTFLTPLFRFFSVLAGIAWIPIATLRFGYGFGAITEVPLPGALPNIVTGIRTGLGFAWRRCLPLPWLKAEIQRPECNLPRRH